MAAPIARPSDGFSKGWAMENTVGSNIRMKKMNKAAACFRLLKKSCRSVTHNPNKKKAPLTQSKAPRLPIPSTQLLRFDQLNIPKAERKLLKKVTSGLPALGVLDVESWLTIGAIQLPGLAAITKIKGKATTMPTIIPIPMRNGSVFIWLSALLRLKYTMEISRLANTRTINTLLVKSPIPVNAEAINKALVSSSWRDLNK